MFEELRIKRGGKVRLETLDADATPGCRGSKEKNQARTAKLLERLEELQGALWAEHRRRLLIVLQGMDTSGKDSTISHVFEGVNPMGVKVAAWKAPSDEELAHDFLWRIHAKVPGAGEMVIFNRSHYEDIVTARVRRLVPDRVWRARYRQVTDFERLLTESGTTILKFFLLIDLDEQKRRLERRLKDPERRWKFQRSDLEDRRRWPAYMRAYGEVLTATSTRDAPWYVVPANHKWYRDLVVSTVIVAALERLRLRHPAAPQDIKDLVIE